ncbi:uncharacterized protein LOC126989348 [Eriocheir sinensis]|uniref:uncharacterized protein LOC126989348 n=1 Tax=Eriocheir sinensis TaxID=95602 RepID=UPI0021C8A52D|nr:uncharacterized protein LOC126989348 [Eriocheir sinensis]
MSVFLSSSPPPFPLLRSGRGRGGGGGGGGRGGGGGGRGEFCVFFLILANLQEAGSALEVIQRGSWFQGSRKYILTYPGSNVTQLDLTNHPSLREGHNLVVAVASDEGRGRGRKKEEEEEGGKEEERKEEGVKEGRKEEKEEKEKAGGGGRGGGGGGKVRIASFVLLRILPFSGPGGAWVQEAGRWYRGRGAVLPSPLYPDLYTNFHGHALKIVTLVYEPFSCYTKNPKTGSLTPSGGCVDNLMVQQLGAALNFTYNFVEPKDGQWGHRLDNGSYTGVIGTVERVEAAFSLNIAITQDREEKVDCTIGYHVEPITFATTKPRLLNQALALIRPFSPGGVRWEARPAPRVYAGVYVLSMYVAVSMYVAMLTASLTLPTLSRTLDTLGEMVESDYAWGIQDLGAADYQLLKTSTVPLYQRVYKGLQVCPALDTCIAKARDTKFAFITWRTYLEDRIAVRFTSPTGEKQLHVATGDIFPVELGWAMNPGSPYRHHFDANIRAMIENGLVTKWLRDVINDPKRRERGDLTSSTTTITSTTTTQALGLHHLQGVFYFLGIGYMTSSLAFLTEALLTWRGHGRLS